MSEATNYLNSEQFLRYRRDIEDCEAQLLSEKMSYASRCRPIHERKKDLLEEAEKAGIPKAILKFDISERKHKRSIRKNYDALDQDHKALVERLKEDLGEFANSPLGAAAVAAAGNGVSMTDAAGKKKKGRPPKVKENGTASISKDALNAFAKHVGEDPDEIPDDPPASEASAPPDGAAEQQPEDPPPT